MHYNFSEQNQNERKLIISIDVDSPKKLLNFYKIQNVTFNQDDLELFYKIAFERALAFFDKLNIKATFFVVGDELENSEVIKNIILKAHQLGHEIENHTLLPSLWISFPTRRKNKGRNIIMQSNNRKNNQRCSNWFSLARLQCKRKGN
jgi:hypothetical protein